jgi:Pathogenicity locus
VKLSDLRNVGKAALADFAVLGIDSVEQLSACNPDTLYCDLQSRTHQRHDPCVWHVFAATVHQAQTGEALNWWEFTAIRKARMAADDFGLAWSDA